jgi:N-acetylglutamate synthase-like GNAT family acetyltransferase
MGSGDSKIVVRPAQQADMETVRSLFREYQEGLGVDLCFQSFDQELVELPGKYAPPTGELLLAELAGDCVGCVAVRALDSQVCEMKRLYVQPPYRRHGIGELLVVDILNRAATLGYSRMVLDTLLRLSPARKLYEKLGFSTMAAYNSTDLEGVMFYGKDLQP